jgi:vitamin K-dependent gamma-carboxylase
VVGAVIARAIRALREKLHAPVDIASLALFRIVFGLVMVVLVYRFFSHDWIREYYVEPKYFFSYWGFGWIKPWPNPGMYIHYGLMGICALLVALGLFYRPAIVAFTALFAYAHLCDKTNYLNHYYLVICLSLLACALPLDRAFSLRTRRNAMDRSDRVPAWMLYALRFQIGVVYFFGGVGKLGADWVFHAEPMRIWLSANSEFPIIGSLFRYPATAYFFSWAGAIFDLGIVPLLSWAKTRKVAYGLVLAFHLMTAKLFQIGMFPWIMMGSALLFFPPDWPRRFSIFAKSAEPSRVFAARAPKWLALWVAWHLLVPLRFLAYSGNVLWTEQGFRFAWRVMLMEKVGVLEVRVRDPQRGTTSLVNPLDYLTRYQLKMTATQPDMILELAHIVRDDFARRGVKNPEVRISADVTLNGRRRRAMIDTSRNLSHEEDGLAAKSWILPLDNE